MRTMHILQVTCTVILGFSLIPAAAAAATGITTLGVAADPGGSPVTSTADVTGDGLDDLIVSTSGRLSGSWSQPPDAGGAVYVVPGGTDLPGSGGTAPVVVNQETTTVPGTSEADDHFGFALATGDFNNDGRDDVAIGSPYEDIGDTRDAGMVTVLYGIPNAPYLQAGATSELHQNQPAFPGATAEAYDRFGQALSTGDYNNDGHADLAISVAYEDLGDIHNAGMLTVLYGSSNGLKDAHNFHQDTAGIPGTPEAGDHFGWSLASGDVTGDGIDDLAQVTDGEAVDGVSGARGDIGVIKGSAGGLTSDPGYSHVNIERIATKDRFSSIVVGKLHGGAYADVIVAADRSAGKPSESGAIVQLRGGSGGIAPTRVVTVNQDTSGVSGDNRAEENDQFGQALAVGDLNADGVTDLAAGTPGEDVSRGAASVFYGGSAGIQTGPDFYFTEATAGIGDIRQDNEKFGRAVAIRNVLSGARPELIVTAPNEENSLKTAAGFVLGINGTSITGSQKLNRGNLNPSGCGSSTIVSCFGPGHPIAGGSAGPVRDGEGLPRRTP